jgi:chromosome segregation ATPase
MPEISPVSSVLASGWDPEAPGARSHVAEKESIEEPAPPAAAAAPEAAPETAPPAMPAMPAAPAERPAAAAASPVGLTDDTDARIRALEAKLEEALAALTRGDQHRAKTEEASYALRGRLEALESDSRSLAQRVEERHQALAQKVDQAGEDHGKDREEVASHVAEMLEKLAVSEKRQRTSEDDISMAIRSFGERGEKVNQQVAAIAAQIEVLEAAIREKTAQSRREADDIRSELTTISAAMDEKFSQGRREAEDIRSQLAPILESHEQRAATDDRLSQEFDRLRESLAESLGDLSERLRRAVRGL